MAARLLGNLDEAERTLAAGSQLSADPRFVESLAAVHIARFDLIESTPDAVVGDGLSHLFDALTLAPGNAQAAGRLSQIVHAAPTLRRHIRLQLTRSIYTEHAAPVVHFLLGILDFYAEDYESSQRHFKIADGHGLQSHILLNNMAWVELQSDRPELERALEMAQAAIDLDPTYMDAVDTRGHIYAKLGRHDLSIIDLERAIPSLRDPAESQQLLRSLRDKYLGLDEADDQTSSHSH